MDRRMLLDPRDPPRTEKMAGIEYAVILLRERGSTRVLVVRQVLALHVGSRMNRKSTQQWEYWCPNKGGKLTKDRPL